jgi:hypothetical protein
MPIIADAEAIVQIAHGTQLVIDNQTYTLKAVYPPPPKIDRAELPCLYALTGSAQDDADQEGDDAAVELRTYRLQLAVLFKDTANAYTRETFVPPWIDEIKRIFRGRPGLRVTVNESTLGVMNTRVMGDSGPVILPEYDGQFIGAEIVVQVVRHIERTFFSGE